MVLHLHPCSVTLALVFFYLCTLHLYYLVLLSPNYSHSFHIRLLGLFTDHNTSHVYTRSALCAQILRALACGGCCRWTCRPSSQYWCPWVAYSPWSRAIKCTDTCKWSFRGVFVDLSSPLLIQVGLPRQHIFNFQIQHVLAPEEQLKVAKRVELPDAMYYIITCISDHCANTHLPLYIVTGIRKIIDHAGAIVQYMYIQSWNLVESSNLIMRLIFNHVIISYHCFRDWQYAGVHFYVYGY